MKKERFTAPCSTVRDAEPPGGCVALTAVFVSLAAAAFAEEAVKAAAVERRERDGDVSAAVVSVVFVAADGTAAVEDVDLVDAARGAVGRGSGHTASASSVSGTSAEAAATAVVKYANARGSSSRLSVS